jgi:murein L,D-transpeptidase YafK
MSIAPPIVRAFILTVAIASIGSCTTVPYQMRTGTVRTPTLRQMESLNMDRAAPVVIRIYKEERTLEVWKQDRVGKFVAQIISDLQIFRKARAEDRPG